MSSSKPLDQVRIVARVKHYSRKTEGIYVNWIKRFILFHHKRHPTEIGEDEVRANLSHLASNRNVAASYDN